MSQRPTIAVVVPCFRVTDTVVSVVREALVHADAVYCVDDACPEQSGASVRAAVDDPRVRVIVHEKNRGVGGAMKTGYRAALDDGHDVVVKLDGDGQMAPALIPQFVRPVLRQQADYAKGNRFFELEFLKGMPTLRLIGNSLLSLLAKVSSGYWNLLDPNNGYTAISATALRAVPLHKVADRFFFESDLLFRLNVARAVVRDVPMRSVYGDERSNLRVGRIVPGFLWGHLRNFSKRIFYNYFLRDFSMASLQLVAGTALVIFSLVFGIDAWSDSIRTGIPASPGTVMLAGLPAILGMQMLLAFLHHDVQNVPTIPLTELDFDPRAADRPAD